MAKFQSSKTKITVCPSCGHSTTERTCPECGQALRGWAYRKARTVTNATYGRPYAAYTKPQQDEQYVKRKVLPFLCIANILLLPLGITWITAFYKKAPATMRTLLGIYALAVGLVMLFVQWGESSCINLVTTILLYIFPGLLAVCRSVTAGPEDKEHM